ncbi:hypothetical protein DAI22_02g075500 [Oryza sativa Japonica Group]|nr:hypothetical protein DAI22_02g075500 [Oryza sativa Japonica Group]
MIVVFLFGHESFNLHHGGLDWVCFLTMPFAVCHGFITITVDTGWNNGTSARWKELKDLITFYFSLEDFFYMFQNVL